MFAWIKSLFSKKTTEPEPEIVHGKVDSPGNKITAANNPLLHAVLTQAMENPGKIVFLNEVGEDTWELSKSDLKKKEESHG
jgi:hypothetical protein